MRAVGIRLLKNRLSEYVRLAAAGERILVTDRDRVVAELVPPRAGTAGLALVGIQRRGVPLARRVAAEIQAHEGAALSVGALDIEFYRDDARLGHAPLVKGTDIGFGVDDLTVVLVDDVLYTGRTIRAAMDALREFGRPRAVRLAVLVDRGHRELPIRADHVGKNVPTSRGEVVRVRVAEVDGEDAVDIEQAAVPAGAAS